MTDRYGDGSEHQALWPESDDFGEADTQLLESLGLRFYGQPNAPRGSAFISNLCDIRSLQFDHRNVQSTMRLSSPCSLELEYTRVMMGFLLFNPAPGIISMIGLGAGPWLNTATITCLQVR